MAREYKWIVPKGQTVHCKFKNDGEVKEKIVQGIRTYEFNGRTWAEGMIPRNPGDDSKYIVNGVNMAPKIWVADFNVPEDEVEW